jgi:methionyl-tRNA formyltransferase
LRRELAIGPHETAGELHDRLASLGAQAIVDAVHGWAHGTLQAQPQPAAGATYASKISKEEARIDWSQPATAIARQVRAFNPWPVAETKLGDEQVRIWDARPATDFSGAPAAPGTVVHADDGRLLVATGDGALDVLTLQFPGRRPLKARDILNSRPLRGERFGEVKS